LYQKLEKWLNSKSYRELEYLDYDKFAKYSAITNDEANEYFKALKKSDLIIEKQVSLCPGCGEECVIDTRLYDKEFECEECDVKFDFTKLRHHSNMSYRINSEFLLRNEKHIKSQFSNENGTVIDISKIRGRMNVDIEGDGLMKVKVFLSYCHEDEAMKNELDKALIMLKRNNKIETWNDRCIIAGSELEEGILKNLESADIILLLVSTDFLASPYCYEKEMKIAIERHNNKEAVVIPVILRSCDWLNSDLKKLTAVPKDGKAIKLWSDPDAAYFEAKEEIEKAIDDYIDRLNSI